ncbi:hypothetical protein H4582DRAFT_1965814 [Lactarius indigo]|nr:hypothetical protein H4582DRAFT_2022271 [Lactarius indigo]KAI9436307.1 hypothetical protein H4582DRAFT_1965814 [Lactarius indigo]
MLLLYTQRALYSAFASFTCLSHAYSLSLPVYLFILAILESGTGFPQISPTTALSLSPLLCYFAYSFISA